MKRNQIIIGVVFSVFLVVSTPVLANAFHKENYASNSDIIREDKVDQKELLFQTILDIANNREIQRVILNSEIRRGGFFNLDTKFSIFTPHVLTKTELNTAYHIGLIVPKNFDVSRIRSMIERYRSSNQALQKEIIAIIEKDATIKGELRQLSNSKCDCENNSGVTSWPFPIICAILGAIGVFFIFLWWWLHVGIYILIIIEILGQIFNCPWTP